MFDPIKFGLEHGLGPRELESVIAATSARPEITSTDAVAEMRRLGHEERRALAHALSMAAVMSCASGSSPRPIQRGYRMRSPEELLAEIDRKKASR